MIGFGFSAKPPDYAYSILDQAALHEALLAHLGVDSVHVLAHNYGDTVVQELLARQAEQEQPALLIRSVCFLNGGLFPEAQDVRRIQKLLLTPLGPLIGRLLTRERFAASFRPIFGAASQPSEEELDDFWQLVAVNEGPRIGHRLIRYLEERRARRQRWVGALQQAAVPLRFIVGAADPVSGLKMAARYRQLVPRADVVVLEGVGHYPQVEAPEATVAHFFAFIDDRVGTGLPPARQAL
jgi:pimeloyl-ACP methyl ester carboxylesterase